MVLFHVGNVISVSVCTGRNTIGLPVDTDIDIIGVSVNTATDFVGVRGSPTQMPSVFQ